MILTESFWFKAFLMFEGECWRETACRTKFSSQPRNNLCLSSDPSSYFFLQTLYHRHVPIVVLCRPSLFEMSMKDIFCNLQASICSFSCSVSGGFLGMLKLLGTLMCWRMRWESCVGYIFYFPATISAYITLWKRVLTRDSYFCRTSYVLLWHLFYRLCRLSNWYQNSKKAICEWGCSVICPCFYHTGSNLRDSVIFPAWDIVLSRTVNVFLVKPLIPPFWWLKPLWQLKELLMASELLGRAVQKFDWL